MSKQSVSVPADVVARAKALGKVRLIKAVESGALDLVDLVDLLDTVEASIKAKAEAEARAAEAEIKAQAGKAAAVAKAMKPSTGKGWAIAAAIAADPSVTKGDQVGAAGWSVANHKVMLSYLYNSGLLSPEYTAKLSELAGGI